MQFLEALKKTNHRTTSRWTSKTPDAAESHLAFRSRTSKYRLGGKQLQTEVTLEV